MNKYTSSEPNTTLHLRRIWTFDLFYEAKALLTENWSKECDRVREYNSRIISAMKTNSAIESAELQTLPPPPSTGEILEAAEKMTDTFSKMYSNLQQTSIFDDIRNQEK